MTERQTSAPPQIVDDVEFTCWHTGIQRCEWRDPTHRIRVRHTHTLTTYTASVDGTNLGKRFRYQSTAMKAAIKALKKKDETK